MNRTFFFGKSKYINNNIRLRFFDSPRALQAIFMLQNLQGDKEFIITFTLLYKSIQFIIPTKLTIKEFNYRLFK